MESLPATAAAHSFGKYSLVARLATGGMAEIFLARLQGAAGFEKLVCIKRILPHLARDRQFVAMFLDEARIAARITHPNVCQVFELGEIAGSYYLAMEYLEGIPLACFRRGDYYGPEPDPRLVAGVAIQACEGLHHAHQLRHGDGSVMEVVHRDVSPQNLFVTADGIVKVLDFGIAKIQGATVRTSTGAIKGTYAYMAPEQLRGERVDRRTDVFALGIVMWETLARRHLFKRDTEFLTFQAITGEPIEDICAIRPDVPPALSSVIMTALARDRDARFPTARMLGEAIAAAVQPLTAGAISEEIQRAFPGELAEQAELIRVAREGGAFDLDVERGPSVGHGAALLTTDLDVERGPSVGHGADLLTTPISKQHRRDPAAQTLSDGPRMPPVGGAPPGAATDAATELRRVTGGMPAAGAMPVVAGDPRRTPGGAWPAAAAPGGGGSEPRRTTSGPWPAVAAPEPVPGEPRRTTGGPWPVPGAPEVVAATPRVPSAVPALRPSWRPLAIAALALATGGAGALIYARLSHEPRRADDGRQAALAAPARPGAVIVEPPPTAAAPPGSTKPGEPRTGDPGAPPPGSPTQGSTPPSTGASATGASATGASATGASATGASATGAPVTRAPVTAAPATAASSPAPTAHPASASYAASQSASAGAATKSDKRGSAPRPAAAVKPSSSPGFITVDSSPVYAVIYIDGKSYGETPLVRLELSPGRHLVHAVAPSGATRDVRIVIESGKVAPAARIAW